jgi:hypothetical protein
VTGRRRWPLRALTSTGVLSAISDPKCRSTRAPLILRPRVASLLGVSRQQPERKSGSEEQPSPPAPAPCRARRAHQR